MVFRSRRPREYFAWKYHDNPAGKAVIMVAEAAGKIVGQVASVPTRLRLGDETVSGAQSLDVMTHPDYRNQGMFLALAKPSHELASSRGIEVIYGFPVPAAFQGYVKRLNAEHVGYVPIWTRLLNPAAVASLSPAKRRIFSLGLPLLPTGKDNPQGVEVREEKPSEEEWVSTASQGATGQLCRVERSADQFRWRFDLASQRRYRWFSAYRGGRFAAWAVYGTNSWGQTPMIDLAGDDRESLVAAASWATRRAKESGLGTLIAFTNEEKAIGALRACGYMQRGKVPFVVRLQTTRSLGPNVHLPGFWRITSEDSDTF